ncbi:hypothetical protein OG698_39610 [Streptomyces sp. NBC_01003]|uniref:hypothetical protein n=1 Tax=Streptomyces sp. NBC_01003 TaxID=2903714 RepID=UPI00386C5960|nr:hypothetical protein OG698_39610 [Streptomyces sp. NBC_01003]
MTVRQEIGALVVDTRTNKLGRVMGRVGIYVQLRAPGGGREWDADPAHLRPANEAERRRATVMEGSLVRRVPS